MTRLGLTGLLCASLFWTAIGCSVETPPEIAAKIEAAEEAHLDTILKLEADSRKTLADNLKLKFDTFSFSVSTCTCSDTYDEKAEGCDPASPDGNCFVDPKRCYIDVACEDSSGGTCDTGSLSYEFGYADYSESKKIIFYARNRVTRTLDGGDPEKLENEYEFGQATETGEWNFSDFTISPRVPASTTNARFSLDPYVIVGNNNYYLELENPLETGGCTFENNAEIQQ